MPAGIVHDVDVVYTTSGLTSFAAGQTCGNVGGVQTRCAAGATCNRPPQSQTGTCLAPAADGAACDTAAGPGCLYPAKCVPASSGGTAGTCELPGDPSCD